MIEHEQAGRQIARGLDGWADTAGFAPWQVDVTEQLLTDAGDAGGIAGLLDGVDTTPPAEPAVTLAEVLEAMRLIRTEQDREVELVRGAAARGAELGVGIVVVRHPDGALTATPDSVAAAGQALVVNGQDLPAWVRWSR